MRTGFVNCIIFSFNYFFQCSKLTLSTIPIPANLCILCFEHTHNSSLHNFSQKSRATNLSFFYLAICVRVCVSLCVYNVCAHVFTTLSVLTFNVGINHHQKTDGHNQTNQNKIIIKKTLETLVLLDGRHTNNHHHHHHHPPSCRTLFPMMIVMCGPSIIATVKLALETEKTWLQCECERWGLSMFFVVFLLLKCALLANILSN